MQVGLIDVDGHSGFPNLALMKLSAWHKAHGDSVEWYRPLFADKPFDRVYMSKVFTFTPDYQYAINAKEIVGGVLATRTIQTFHRRSSTLSLTTRYIQRLTMPLGSSQEDASGNARGVLCRRKRVGFTPPTHGKI